MTYSRRLGQYKKVGVETAGKLDLVIMSYDKALEMLRHAKQHYVERRFEEKAADLKKALDIINSLQSAINFEKGGEIAKNLDSIYTYLTRRLLEGDSRKDMTVFDEAIRILSELGEAWRSIASGDRTDADRIPVLPQPEMKVTQIAA